jgi:hypothetical protein
LPANFLDLFNRAEADPNLLELQDEVKMIDAFAAELLGRLDGSNTADEIWAALVKARHEVAASQGDAARFAQAVQLMLDLIDQGADTILANAHIRHEVTRLMAQRANLVVNERRLQDMDRRTITKAEVQALIGAIVNILVSTIDDSDTLEVIQTKIRALFMPRALTNG